MYDINIYNKYIYNTFISREPSEHEQSPSNRDIEFGRIFRITSRLAFSIHVDQRQTKLEIMRQRDVYFFSSTFHESYVSFCEDDGPVNLSAVAQFCWYVRSKLTDPRLEGRTCVYYAESNSALRSNAIFLLAAFLVLVDGYTPEQAVECFEPMGPRYCFIFDHTRPLLYQQMLRLYLQSPPLHTARLFIQQKNPLFH